VLIRIGLWLSAITLVAIEGYALANYLIDKHQGDEPAFPGYLMIGPIYGAPAVAVIWLGVFVASVIRKGAQLAREP
jgi:hypothetical protein